MWHLEFTHEIATDWFSIVCMFCRLAVRQWTRILEWDGYSDFLCQIKYCSFFQAKLTSFLHDNRKGSALHLAGILTELLPLHFSSNFNGMQMSSMWTNQMQMNYTMNGGCKALIPFLEV